MSERKTLVRDINTDFPGNSDKSKEKNEIINNKLIQSLTEILTEIALTIQL